MNNIVTILCSGVAMGVYTPALAVRYQLKKLNINSEVIVLEDLYVKEKRDKLNDTKKVFHNNFRIAKKAHEMARDITTNLDNKLMDELFSKWKEEGRHLFIVFSGFWIPILINYKDFIYPQEVYSDLVIVDSVISPSWKSFKGNIPENFNITRLFNCDENTIIQKVFMPEKPCPAFSDRENRLVIHGGGWGMGTFESYVPELNALGIDLNVIVYFEEEDFKKHPQNKYFMIDPSWRPWNKDNDGKVEFPPFGEVYTESENIFSTREEYNELFYLIGNSKGIISKPGGSTLVESLASATPIIFLDALGEHEEKNAELWIHLGLGITYEEWKSQGFSFEVLEKLHKNILNAQKLGNDYATSYKKLLKQI